MTGPKQCILAMTLLATSAAAQIRLPSVPLPNLPQPLQTLPQTGLDDLRHLEITRLIRVNRRVVDTDPNGEPVVREEILALSPTEAALTHAAGLNFVVDRERIIAAMNIRVVIFKAPQGMSTKAALRKLREADPAGTYEYNHIYSGSGMFNGNMSDAGMTASIESAQDAPRATPPESSSQVRVRIGLLDTGVDTTHPVFRESLVHTWGCANMVVPAAHGTAVASLLVGRAAVFRGVQPDAELYAADVFCGAPTGGATDALVAALGWMVQASVPVINISLVGPKNVMLERVIGALVAGGYVIVAAVGNDGPAAPPLYPASYAHVVGVTAVDSHRHVLIEAARGPQVMFAAPGSDLDAAAADHAYASVRGTSFAAPIVAALLARGLTAPNPADASQAIDTLAKAAIDLGPPGRDLTYGFGLVGVDYLANGRNHPPGSYQQ
jgi:subtilisin family serine protease